MCLFLLIFFPHMIEKPLSLGKPQFHIPHHIQDGDCFKSIIVIEVIINHINDI